jgi:hypothetical protein
MREDENLKDEHSGWQYFTYQFEPDKLTRGSGEPVSLT